MRFDFYLTLSFDFSLSDSTCCLNHCKLVHILSCTYNVRHGSTCRLMLNTKIEPTRWLPMNNTQSKLTPNDKMSHNLHYLLVYSANKLSRLYDEYDSMQYKWNNKDGAISKTQIKMNKSFQSIIVNIFLPIILAFVLDSQKNHLIETVILSTHYICFG